MFISSVKKDNEGQINTIKEHVFFCEGPSEVAMLKVFNKAFGDIVNFKAYIIPDCIHNKDIMLFGPKRIADYCERVKSYIDNNENDAIYTKKHNWNYYEYTVDFKRTTSFKDNKEIIMDLKENPNIPIYLLVDTDVFFKTRLQNKDKYINLYGVPGNRVADCLRCYFLNGGNCFRFCEQELNFEDFFVMCFVEDEKQYEKWFTARFQTPNIINGRRKNQSDYGYTDNDAVNGKELKRRLEELIGQKPLDWLNEQESGLKKFDMKFYVEQCIKRINKNRQSMDEDGNEGPNGWPFRFGIVDILNQYTKQL